MHTIELLTTHTHAGAIHRPGDRLVVDAFTARWLIARGAARHVTEADGDGAPPATETEPALPTRRRTRRASPEIAPIIDPTATPTPTPTLEPSLSVDTPETPQ